MFKKQRKFSKLADFIIRYDRSVVFTPGRIEPAAQNTCVLAAPDIGREAVAEDDRARSLKIGDFAEALFKETGLRFVAVHML